MREPRSARFNTIFTETRYGLLEREPRMITAYYPLMIAVAIVLALAAMLLISKVQNRILLLQSMGTT